VTNHRWILERASTGTLPTSINSTSELPLAVVRELVEAGYLAAVDATTLAGIEYLDPRITMSGREHLRALQQSEAEPAP
jgi:hypothetical protein